MARILALDVGGKRTGIAVTDPLQIICTALDTVQTVNLMDYLTDYIAKEDVESIVVGYPENNNLPTDSSPIIAKVIKQINKKFPDMPLHTVDESFTSKNARKILVESGYKKKDRQKKENTDKISAVLILKTFLNEI
ncbi:MAG: Holliday junction resolvase RuvX [Chitinophagaceae bacterium]|nr:MAG: Holliday junction resolvase RuvX [Chitinophagaceae bacterium]